MNNLKREMMAKEYASTPIGCGMKPLAAKFHVSHTAATAAVHDAIALGLIDDKTSEAIRAKAVNSARIHGGDARRTASCYARLFASRKALQAQARNENEKQGDITTYTQLRLFD